MYNNNKTPLFMKNRMTFDKANAGFKGYSFAN
jgi:hypothetical protein